MVLDLDRNQIDRGLLAAGAEGERDNVDEVAAAAMRHRARGAALGQHRADEFGIRAVDDQIAAGSYRDLEALSMQAFDIVRQPIRVGGADRGQFLHADLDCAREVLYPGLRALNHRLLRAEADRDLSAKR